VELPCTTDCEVGLTESEKSGVGTTTPTLAECVSAPLVPVAVAV
jgi:hypothetical protein